MPCKICSARFKILLHAKYNWGQIGLPKLKQSLRPHVSVSVTENSYRQLVDKEQYIESRINSLLHCKRHKIILYTFYFLPNYTV
jgi:hypothetical protein